MSTLPAENLADPGGLVARVRALCRPMAPLPTGVQSRLQPLPDVRAVLLDVYGTILAAGRGEVGTEAEANEEAARRALTAAGFSCFRPDAPARAGAMLHAVIREAHARSRSRGVDYPEVEIRDVWRRVLARLSADHAIEGEVTDDRVEALAVEYECRVNPVWPMPGLAAMVSALAGAELRLGILSNAQFYTPLQLSAFPATGWGDGAYRSDLCLWSYRERVAKPSARLVERALDRLRARYGILPGQTLCVGNDRLNDVVPAARCGCRTALYAGDARSLRLRPGHSECADVEPDLVITELAQLPPPVRG